MYYCQSILFLRLLRNTVLYNLHYHSTTEFRCLAKILLLSHVLIIHQISNKMEENTYTCQTVLTFNKYFEIIKWFSKSSKVPFHWASSSKSSSSFYYSSSHNLYFLKDKSASNLITPLLRNSEVRWEDRILLIALLCNRISNCG